MYPYPQASSSITQQRRSQRTREAEDWRRARVARNATRRPAEGRSNPWPVWALTVSTLFRGLLRWRRSRSSPIQTGLPNEIPS
jgi:hypothetical protein